MSALLADEVFTTFHTSLVVYLLLLYSLEAIAELVRECRTIARNSNADLSLPTAPKGNSRKMRVLESYVLGLVVRKVAPGQWARHRRRKMVPLPSPGLVEAGLAFFWTGGRSTPQTLILCDYFPENLIYGF